MIHYQSKLISKRISQEVFQCSSSQVFFFFSNIIFVLTVNFCCKSYSIAKYIKFTHNKAERQTNLIMSGIGEKIRSVFSWKTDTYSFDDEDYIRRPKVCHFTNPVSWAFHTLIDIVTINVLESQMLIDWVVYVWQTLRMFVYCLVCFYNTYSPNFEYLCPFSIIHAICKH